MLWGSPYLCTCATKSGEVKLSLWLGCLATCSSPCRFFSHLLVLFYYRGGSTKTTSKSFPRLARNLAKEDDGPQGASSTPVWGL